MADSATKKKQYFYSVGKRKTAIARIKMYVEGKGNVTVNGAPLAEALPPIQQENAVAPLALIGKQKEFDIDVTISGGGYAAQSDALRLGISRGLIIFDPELRADLKRAGYLRRDARVKERKKPGLKKARKSPQWAKR